jgi:hypothetical protein
MTLHASNPAMASGSDGQVIDENPPNPTAANGGLDNTIHIDDTCGDPANGDCMYIFSIIPPVVYSKPCYQLSACSLNIIYGLPMPYRTKTFTHTIHN